MMLRMKTVSIVMFLAYYDSITLLMSALFERTRYFDQRYLQNNIRLNYYYCCRRGCIWRTRVKVGSILTLYGASYINCAALSKSFTVTIINF
jgi:hypothetical protein